MLLAAPVGDAVAAALGESGSHSTSLGSRGLAGADAQGASLACVAVLVAAAGVDGGGWTRGRLLLVLLMLAGHGCRAVRGDSKGIMALLLLVLWRRGDAVLGDSCTVPGKEEAA